MYTNDWLQYNIPMFRKSISSVLLVLATPVLLSTALIITLWLTLFSPTFYLDVLSASHTYERIIMVVPSLLFQSFAPADVASSSEDTEQTLPLTQKELSRLIQRAIPPTFLEEQVATILTAALPYLQGKTNEVHVVVPYSTITDAWSQELGDIMAQRIAALPTCTRAQLQQLSEINQGPFSLTCIPAYVNADAFQAEILAGITGEHGLLTQLPETLDLNTLLATNPHGVEPLRQAIQTAKTAMLSLIILSLALLAALSLVNARHPSAIPHWIGLAFFSPGISILVASLIAQFGAPAILPSLLSAVVPSGATSNDIQSLLVPIANEVGSSLGRALLWPGIILLAAALLLLTLNYILKKRATAGITARRSSVEG